MARPDESYCTFFSACLPPYHAMMTPPPALDFFFYHAAREWEFMVAPRVFFATT